MTKRPRVKQEIIDEIMKYDGKSFNECLLSYMHNHNMMAIEYDDFKLSWNDVNKENLEKHAELWRIKTRVALLWGLSACSLLSLAVAVIML